ncbi:Histidine phosphatase superfamily (branch 1) [Phytophthora infestans]|uniref:Histidine phosphatase superfamily (Branch 1) n=1 Tax=Phytophthora infestans TaxID=4787 RepID=A0A833RQB1_PHYIN|nr:Histidine phosphatase superfamily (branch 1) [Phytophthora infestans]
MENCREVFDCYTFDKRRSLLEIKQKFPDVDFSRVTDEEDLLWSPTHHETEDEIRERARNFLSELFDAVPERYVVVASHVCFIQAVCAVTMGIHFRPDNCEVVPLVLETF